MIAVPICLALERHAVWRALSRACAKTGKRIAARMAIIAITTRSSISVKAKRIPRMVESSYLLFCLYGLLRQIEAGLEHGPPFIGVVIPHLVPPQPLRM